MAGELDGGLPVVRHGVLVGLIPAPDLEFALDKLEDEESCQCLMATHIPWRGLDDDEDREDIDKTDFTPYIDPVSGPFREHHCISYLRTICRLLSPWTSTPPWTLCISASSSSGYDIFVF